MQRVLFTGLGSIGQRHLRLLRERDELFDIHAYRSGKSNIEPRDDITEHKDLHTALSVDPDIAFITNPTALHVNTAVACAREGCHLFIEKPLSHTNDGVEELIDEAEKRDLITCMGCQLRYHPILKHISTLLSKNKIGEIYSYKVFAGSYLPEWRPQQDYRETYSAHSSMGGGVVLDLIHELDYSYWLFGDVETVQGWTGNVSGLEIEAEDLAEVILQMKSGSVGQIHLDYYRIEPRRTIEIVGKKGIINGDLNTGVVKLQMDDQTRTERFDIDRDDMFKEQLDEFFTKIQAGEYCENDLREGKRVLNIALKAKGER